MTLRAFFALAAVPVLAQTPELPRLLESVEKRYNQANTLQVTFEERLSGVGRSLQAESGQLSLRKPGRMRWDYTTPAGKLFLSDGKNIYYYNPNSKRAEKLKFKESDDMRAPLAFLLGKLDFDKDFSNFRATAHPLGTMIAANPKSDKLPYKQVEFVVDAAAAIRELRVHGHDNSLMSFNFSNEKVNPPVSDKIFRFELPPAQPGLKLPVKETRNKVAEFVLKYADARGAIHNQVAEGASENELRDRLTQQGYLVYSVRPRNQIAGISTGFGGRKKLNVEKFLIFNQQFVTLIKAGLPILKGLDLLSERLTDPKLKPYVSAVRDEVRHGALLSDAFARQGIFPTVYVTSVLAGEKGGALAEVLERFITYQRTALAIRKKIMLSLLYPSFLVVLVVVLIVFLVTYVVPNFAQLYGSMQAQLPVMTQILIAVGTTARSYVLLLVAVLIGAVIGFRYWARGEAARLMIDRAKLRTPVFGDIWVKYQVAQFSRVLSTLLQGGVPLVQALGTASESLGTPLLKQALERAVQMVKEGQALSQSLTATGVFPALAIDMVEVGESTGALPAMLNSVAEFYEDDVSTRMQAALSLIEPAIMIFMGIFVAFVLIALYLPIFSLADTLGK